MLQTICNEEREPLGQEYVNEPWENEIASAEEMDFLAENPFEAVRLENQKWYDRALAAFEEKGVKVPYEVVCILSRELKKKQADTEKAEAIAELKPAVEFLQKLGYVVETYYEYPTPIEYGYAYLEIFDKDGKELSRQKYEELRDLAWDKGITF